MDILRLIVWSICLFLALFFLFRDNAKLFNKLKKKYVSIQDARFENDLKQVQRLKAKNAVLNEKNKASRAKSKTRNEREKLIKERFKGLGM